MQAAREGALFIFDLQKRGEHIIAGGCEWIDNKYLAEKFAYNKHTSEEYHICITELKQICFQHCNVFLGSIEWEWETGLESTGENNFAMDSWKPTI